MSDKQSEVIEAQSAFSSTLINDMETPTPEGSARKRIMSIEPHPGTDAVCAAKSALLSQALQDLGMGRHQWFLVLVTCIGWFLDSVCLYSAHLSLIFRASTHNKDIQLWLISFKLIAPPKRPSSSLLQVAAKPSCSSAFASGSPLVQPQAMDVRPVWSQVYLH